MVLTFSRLRSNLTPACVLVISSLSFCFNLSISPCNLSFSALRLVKSVFSLNSKFCLRDAKSTCHSENINTSSAWGKWREELTCCV